MQRATPQDTSHSCKDFSRGGVKHFGTICIAALHLKAYFQFPESFSGQCSARKNAALVTCGTKASAEPFFDKAHPSSDNVKILRSEASGHLAL